MAALAFVVPIIPGKEEVDKQYMREATGSRRQEYGEWRKSQGVKREAVWHQQTPQGTVSIVYIEADDPQAVLQSMGTSNEPIAQWFRQCMMEIHGMDLTQPPPGPPSELVVDERY
ncbi:MAG TPA: hypothetical protein VKX16_15595 [Chloroflexota bacterium]|nr:hypothetical protein [Chloroflexota bacterium]